MHRTDIDKAYQDYIENDNMTGSETVMARYKEMREAFDCYIDKLTEWGWKAGFSYALTLQGKRNTGGQQAW